VRTVDRLIDYICEAEWLGSPTQRQVMINRLEAPPTREELDKAKAQLYPNEVAR
jgi:hypothetical protein